MSPFQGAGNFVEDICKMFQKTLEEEISVSHLACREDLPLI